MGGGLRLGTEVAEVLSKGGRVYGVTTKADDEYPGAVISNPSPHYTSQLQGLLAYKGRQDPRRGLWSTQETGRGHHPQPYKEGFRKPFRTRMQLTEVRDDPAAADRQPGSIEMRYISQTYAPRHSPVRRTFVKKDSGY